VHGTELLKVQSIKAKPVTMKLLSLVAVVIASAGSASAFSPSAFSSSRSSSAIAPKMAGADAGEFYIDQDRRNLMNLILLGSATVTVGSMAVPFIAFFLPPIAAGTGGALALDALGAEIDAKSYVESKPAGDHSLAQGLKGDATYIIVKDDKTIESYGLNAVCTHLGCVVPWSAPNKKFMCPCHGSQYAPDGHVVRGPAPLPLALAHCDVNPEGKIVFSTWSETDFRTGSKGWWM
jgi:cytochrome b6-f complex iron-sulfur subunit